MCVGVCLTAHEDDISNALESVGDEQLLEDLAAHQIGALTHGASRAERACHRASHLR